MKISQCYSAGATKLCHRQPGDVIQLQYNDGKVDKEIYLVITDGGSLPDNVVCLRTGKCSRVHTSTRCIHFQEAICVPEPNLD